MGTMMEIRPGDIKVIKSTVVRNAYQRGVVKALRASFHLCNHRYFGLSNRLLSFGVRCHYV